MKHLKCFRALMLTAVTIAGSACCVAAEGRASDPLVIQKQSSFAVGGTVVTAPGKFDPFWRCLGTSGALKA